MNKLSILLALGINLTTPSFAVSVLCNLDKLESDFDSDILQETKKCILSPTQDVKDSENNDMEKENKDAKDVTEVIDENCKIIHQATTTEIKLKNNNITENKIKVELNNMNEEKPLVWEVRVEIDNKPKTLIHMGTEKIDISCLSQNEIEIENEKGQ